jgi:hypothetical protein
MTVRVSWLYDDYILLVQLSGQITPDEVDQWMNKAIEMMDRYPGLLHSVLELTPGTRLSLNPFKLQSPLNVIRHKNSGLLVAVGLTPLLGFWLQTFQRIAGLRFRATETIEDAVEFIRGLREIEREKNMIQPTSPEPLLFEYTSEKV